MNVRRRVALSVLPIALLAAPVPASAVAPAPPGVTVPAPVQFREVSWSIGSTFTDIPADGTIAAGQSYRSYSVSAVRGSVAGATSSESTWIQVQIEYGHGEDGEVVWDRGEFYTTDYHGDPGAVTLNAGLTSGRVQARLTNRSTTDYRTWELSSEQSEVGWPLDLVFTGDKGSPSPYAGTRQDSYSGFRFISHGHGMHRDGVLRGTLLGEPDPQARLGMRQMTSAGRGGQGTLQFCQRGCVPFE